MEDEIYSISEELGNYSVSNYGNVLNKTTGYTLKHTIDKKDTHHITLSVKSRTRQIAIHRLVAFIYIDNPTKDPYVRHKDGNKNNNYVNNLEWYHNILRIGAHEKNLYSIFY